MPKVPYTQENIDRCQCGKCPLYLSSACAKSKNATIDWESGELPPPNVIEGIYCAAAVGKSRCDDLDRAQACKCPTCPVWEDYELQDTYFCIHGAAR